MYKLSFSVLEIIKAKELENHKLLYIYTVSGDLLFVGRCDLLMSQYKELLTSTVSTAGKSSSGLFVFTVENK